jgi:hypothetical protein
MWLVFDWCWYRELPAPRPKPCMGDVLAFLQGGIEQGRSVRESLGLLRERGPVALRADFGRPVDCTVVGGQVKARQRPARPSLWASQPTWANGTRSAGN